MEVTKSMYIDHSNPVLDERNYIQTRVPDITALGNLLKRAKGNGRTMAEYAKECEASPSMFSRIATGKITKPLSFEIVVNIWKHADPEARISFIELVTANGFVDKSFAEKKEKRRPGSFEREEAQFSTEREIKNIIMEELLDRGLEVLSQRRIHLDENVPAVVSGAGRSRLILRIKGYEPKYWFIEAMSYIGVRRGFYGDEPVPEIDFECEASVMFHDSAEIFLKDAWEPERMEKVHVSFAFTDIETLEAFYNKIKPGKVHGWVSLILVDLDSQVVLHERYIPRKDGKTTTSLFELPIQNDDSDWQDVCYREP